MNNTHIVYEILSLKTNSEILSESSNSIDMQNVEMVISVDY